MEKFQNFEKYNMLECFLECQKDSRAACDLYFERYPERQQPDLRIFPRLENNLINYGSFSKPRPKTYQKENKENETINVLACVAADPTTSLRNIEKDIGVVPSKSSHLLKTNKFKCYKPRKTHHLHPGDSERRVQFCNWYLNMLREDELFFTKIIWTDETRITSDGIFNRHNNHLWADHNPHQQVNRVYQGRFGFNVWVALLGNRVLAYEVFEENLNSEIYFNILERHIISYLDNIPLQERESLFFQHDGAPPHNAAIVVNCLNTNFGEKWLANNGPIRWPARSPDITPLDFYFWGFLKNKIYSVRSNTVEELRENFEAALRSIKHLNIWNSMNGVRRRCQLCINANGLQFEHLL